MGIKAGGFEFGCVGCCLPVGSAMSRKLLFVRWPPDFSITELRSVGKIGVIGYYLQRSCPSNYIRHIHYAFIIIFETRSTGCCYGHAPRLARSPPHGTSFGWFAFPSSHPCIPAHGISGLYPSSRRGRPISPSLNIRAWARLVQIV